MIAASTSCSSTVSSTVTGAAWTSVSAMLGNRTGGVGMWTLDTPSRCPILHRALSAVETTVYAPLVSILSALSEVMSMTFPSGSSTIPA